MTVITFSNNLLLGRFGIFHFHFVSVKNGGINFSCGVRYNMTDKPAEFKSFQSCEKFFGMLNRMFEIATAKTVMSNVIYYTEVAVSVGKSDIRQFVSPLFDEFIITDLSAIVKHFF